jgi:hypothetical protein
MRTATTERWAGGNTVNAVRYLLRQADSDFGAEAESEERFSSISCLRSAVGRKQVMASLLQLRHFFDVTSAGLFGGFLLEPGGEAI